MKNKILTFGTFDILHLGHIYYLKEAKKHASALYVIVARDKTVKKIKGRTPFFNERERIEMINQLRIVNKAFLGDLSDYYKLIGKIKPDIIFLGYDQKAFTKGLYNFVKKGNSSIKIMRCHPFRRKKYKSSKIRNTYA